MNDAQRRRAGRAVADRIREIDATVTGVARDARIAPGTLWSLIAGRTWPRDAAQSRLEAVLGWEDGEILTRAALEPWLLNLWLRSRCVQSN